MFPRSTCVALAALAVLASLALCATAGANATISPASTTSGITSIVVGDDLSCQAHYLGVSDGEFFGGDPGSCGTFVRVADSGGANPVTYKPGTIGATGASNFNPISQTQTGGPNTSPVETVVNAGLVRIDETVSFTANTSSYTTSYTVTNNDSVAHDVQVFQYADCFLQSSDTGTGALDQTSHAPACTSTPDSTALGSESFIPASSTGVSYEEGGYSAVLADVVAGTLTDACNTTAAPTDTCSTSQDNGMAIAMPVHASLAPGSSFTESFTTTFTSAVTIQHVVSGATTTNERPTFMGTLASGGDTSTFTVGLTNSTDATVGLGTTDTTTTPGQWSVAPTAALVPGDYRLTASESTSPTTGSATSTVSSTFTIAGLAITDPGDGSSLTDTMPTIAGTYATGSGDPVPTADLRDSANQPVTLQTLSTTGAPDFGQWSTAPAAALAPGTYTFSIVQGTAQKSATFTVLGSGTGSGSAGGGGGSSGGTPATTTTQTPPASSTTPPTQSSPPSTTQQSTQQQQPPPPPPPTADKSGNAEPVSGEIYVQLPNGQVLPLRSITNLPVGTIINATHGTVSLTVAIDNAGHFATGQFTGGIFRFSQHLVPLPKKSSHKHKRSSHKKRSHSRAAASAKRNSKPRVRKVITDLKLVAGNTAQCPKGSFRGHRRRRDADAARRRVARYLRAKAHGNFDVIGKHASGLERGTEWKTTDTCDSTEIAVSQGTVSVTDFTLHKTFKVKAGHTYVAHAKTTKRKRRR